MKRRIALYTFLVILAAVTWPISAYVGGAFFLIAAGMTISDEFNALLGLLAAKDS